MVLASTDSVPRADYDAALSEREAAQAECRVALARAESAEARLGAPEQQLGALKRQRFGASSENADQLTMFDSADIELIEQEIKSEVPVAPKRTVVERQRLALSKGLLGRIQLLPVKIDHRPTTRTIQINAGLLQQLNLPSPRPSARRSDKSAPRALRNQPLTAAAACELEGASHPARYRRKGDTSWSTLGNEPRLSVRNSTAEPGLE